MVHFNDFFNDSYFDIHVRLVMKKTCLASAQSDQHIFVRCLDSIISIFATSKIARPLESQQKLEAEFHRVPYNQTFDFVTGQFVKILSPACS